MCNRVDGKDILKILKKKPDASLEQVSFMTGASLSCGRCRNRLVQYIEMNRRTTAVQLSLYKPDDFG